MLFSPNNFIPQSKIPKEVMRELNREVKNSDVFKRFNSIRYKSPHNYMEFDRIVLEISRCLYSYNYTPLDILNKDWCHRCAIITLNQVYHNGFRPFAISQNLLNLFMRTNIPHNIREIKQVIPYGLLLLPNILKNPDGQYIRWVLFHHKLKNDNLETITIRNAIIDIRSIDTDSLSWFAYLEDGSQYGSNHSLKLENNKLTELNVGELHINSALLDNNKNIEVKSEQLFSNTITNIILQFILYMQLERNMYISKSTISKNKGFTKSKHNQRIPIDIIGNDCKIQIIREYNNSNSNIDNKRQSPITHWRSGYWRHQQYGTRKNPEYKLIWIEPTLINKI